MNYNNKTGTKSSRPDSSLTFAVIWDPENGLEAYPCSHLFETPIEQPLAHEDFFDSWPQLDETVSTQLHDEPFAVFNAGRQLHYIDIRSSKMYKDFNNARLSYGPSLQSSASSYSHDSWRTSSCFAEKLGLKELPPPPILVEARQSLDSFFPLWSGRFGAHTKPDRHALLKPHLMDNEGFFDVPSHGDCDPHLPSRFSISDTSTSAYIAIDRSASGPGTPMSLHHRSPLVSRIPDSEKTVKSVKSDGNLSDKASGLAKSMSDHVPHLTSQLSKLLPPWMKRPRDDKWVLVEVRAVVLERVIDD